MLALAILASFLQEDPEGIAFFENRIRPVLVARCYRCHSVGAEKVKGGLLLDSREGVLQVITPGRPDQSRLIQAIRPSDDDMRMPPKGELLSAAEVADFESWIRRGAPDPRKKDAKAVAARAALDVRQARAFWSFKPVVDPGGSIDALLEARMGGLAPVGPADRATLLRRVTYDLTGLPPTPEEIESGESFEQAVERLLASPRYGERWGRHWLDLVRYADTAGDSSDFPIPQAARYRDWVIRAFNEDKPYDRFLREQVAGDLIPDADLVATGYLALARRFGIKPESFHHLTIEDTIDNLGRTVLGLTLSCSRCHDHKFDPIPTDDYYGLYGIFQSTKYPYPGSETTKFQKDFPPLTADGEAALRSHRETLAALDAELKRLEDAKSPELKKAKKDRDAFAMKPLPIETAFAVSEGKARNASIHIKGDPDKPGAEVPRRFLQVLGGQAVSQGSGRRELALWLTDPANPLTARVMVNRIWQHHFGRGIVATPSDFGRQGRAPSHPELLDYLARRFVDSGWSVKAMHRLLLNTAAYQRASSGLPENAKVDPDDLLLWKFPRRRLEAEEIRDTMLVLSDELDLSPGGVHPFPPSTAWDYSQAKPFTADDARFDHRRRTVYWMTQRLKRRRFMEIFDGPDPNSTTPARTSTTTPLQALYMMNDAFCHERATKFAARLIAARPDDARRIELAYRLVLGRPPSCAELEDCEKYLRGFHDSEIAWKSLARILLSSNEFMFLR